jgi:hypothetical protein
MKWDKKIQDARVRQNNISYEKEKIDIKKKTIYKYFELFQIKRQKMNLEKEMDISKKYKEVVMYPPEQLHIV